MDQERYNANLEGMRRNIPPCLYCRGQHRLEWCLEFQDLNHVDRIQYCLQHRICLICLADHPELDCPERNRLVCGVRGCRSLMHHQIFHCDHRGTYPANMLMGLPLEGAVTGEFTPIPDEKSEGQESKVKKEEQLDDSGIDIGGAEAQRPTRSTTISRSQEYDEIMRKILECAGKLRPEPGSVIPHRPRVAVPRPVEGVCELCPYASHCLGDCPGYLALSIEDREIAAASFACVICLEVDHFTPDCPISQRECGIYSCKLNHHPTLHRRPYILPLSKSDYAINWNLHQQARLESLRPPRACALCGERHRTRHCPDWPEDPVARMNTAMVNYLCLRCLTPEHGKCPADQTICGINRCVEHHDPFLHRGGPHIRTGNSWAELHQAHRDWVARRDVAAHRARLNVNHEQAYLLDRFGNDFPIEQFFGNQGGHMPPFSAARTRQGLVVLTDEVFRRLCAAYQGRGIMTHQLSALSVREMILSVSEEDRQIILAEELRMARDDPARLDPIIRDPLWSDGMYLYRQTCRDIALELYPHPEYDPGNDPVEYQPTAETEDSTEDDEENGEDEAEEEPGEDQRVLRAGNRPVLSGNPDEGPGPSSSH